LSGSEKSKATREINAWKKELATKQELLKTARKEGQVGMSESDLINELVEAIEKKQEACAANVQEYLAQIAQRPADRIAWDGEALVRNDVQANEYARLLEAIETALDDVYKDDLSEDRRSFLGTTASDAVIAIVNFVEQRYNDEILTAARNNNQRADFHGLVETTTIAAKANMISGMSGLAYEFYKLQTYVESSDILVVNDWGKVDADAR